MLKETFAMTPNWLRKPLRQPAVDLWTMRGIAHNPTATTTTEAVN
jgi:hypothetical protein